MEIQTGCQFAKHLENISQSTWIDSNQRTRIFLPALNEAEKPSSALWWIWKKNGSFLLLVYFDGSKLFVSWRMHSKKFPLTPYTLTSVCIFSILFPMHFHSSFKSITIGTVTAWELSKIESIPCPCVGRLPSLLCANASVGWTPVSSGPWHPSALLLTGFQHTKGEKIEIPCIP